MPLCCYISSGLLAYHGMHQTLPHQTSATYDVKHFSLSELELLNDDENDWGFTLFDGADEFVATFTYHSKDAARRARNAFVLALQDIVFLASEK